MNWEEISERCKAKVATRSIPRPTEAEIDYGVPVFLDQLRNALRLGETHQLDRACKYTAGTRIRRIVEEDLVWRPLQSWVSS